MTASNGARPGPVGPLDTPKSESVTEQGQPDGWVPPAGFVRELESGAGTTRVAVSVPHTHLLDLHVALARTLAEPVSVLYRQLIDRRDPKPQGSPPRDFVAVDQRLDRVIAGIEAHTSLLHHDARCELWLRGSMGEQLVLDADGMLFCYPDDPAFGDVLGEHGLDADVPETIADRNFVKHWFHAENDAVEDAFVRALQLTEVPARGR